MVSMRSALRLWMPIAVVRCASGCPSPSCAAPLDAHRRRALRRRASHRMLAATDRNALYSFHSPKYIGIPLETLTCSD